MPSRTRSEPRVPAARVLTFLLTAALVSLVALLDGGYDIVTRQELGLLVWWVLGLGLLCGVLLPRRAPVVVWLPVVALLLLAAWATVSLEWTESTERTVAEVTRYVGYLGLLVLTLLSVRRRTVRPAIGGATAGAVLVCVLALINRLTASRLGVDVGVDQFASTRLSYPLDYWNAMGTWGAITLVLALSAAIHERKLLVRSLAAAAIPIVAVTTYLTYSRTAVASIALGVAVVVLTSRRRWAAAAQTVVAAAGAGAILLVVRDAPAIANGTGTAGAGDVALMVVGVALVSAALTAAIGQTRLSTMRMSRRAGLRTMAVGIAAVLLGGAALAVSAYPSLRDSFENRAAPSVSSDPAARLTNLNGTRRYVWEQALDAFSAHPVDGVGAGAFELWWNRHGTPEFVKDAHSLYLEALAELGVPGLLLTLLFALSLLAMVSVSRLRAPPQSYAHAGVRTAALAVVATFLVSAGVDWMWESTAVTALTLVVAGASGAALLGERRRLALPWRAGLAVAALVGCLVMLPGLVSTSEIRASQRAMRAGDVDAALADARDARSAAPWASSPAIQLGLVAESVGDYRVAQRLMEDAVARDPWDFRPWALLARVAAENGDVARARAAYRRAAALRPRSVLFTGAPLSAKPATPRRR